MAISKDQALEDLKSYNPEDPQFTEEELIERCNIVLKRFPDENFYLVPEKLQFHGDWLRRALVFPSFLESMDVSLELARAAVRLDRGAIYYLPENIKDDEEVQLTVIEDISYLSAFDRICQRAANAALIGIINSDKPSESKKTYREALFKVATQSNVTFAEAVDRYPHEIFTVPSTFWTAEMADVAIRELDHAAPPLTHVEASNFMSLLPPPRVAEETVKRYPNSLLSLPDENWTELLVYAAINSDKIDYNTAKQISKHIKFYTKHPDRFTPGLIETAREVETMLYELPTTKGLGKWLNLKAPDRIKLQVLTTDCPVVVYRSGDQIWVYGDSRVEAALTTLFQETKESMRVNATCWHVNIDGINAERTEEAEERNQIEKGVAEQFKINHRFAPMFDFEYDADQFEFALRTLAKIYKLLDPVDDRVLLHCSVGMGRSAACLELYYRMKVGAPDTEDAECEAWLREHHSECGEWIDRAKRIHTSQLSPTPGPELRRRIKGVARATLTNVLFSDGMYGPGTLRDLSSE